MDFGEGPKGTTTFDRGRFMDQLRGWSPGHAQEDIHSSFIKLQEAKNNMAAIKIKSNQLGDGGILEALTLVQSKIGDREIVTAAMKEAGLEKYQERLYGRKK